VYPERRSPLVGRVVDGELVLLDRQRNRVHQLNATATYIWDRCDGRHTVAAIARDVQRVFAVDVKIAGKDVARAVQELEAVGLVRVRSGPIASER
jgi:hypothetical protein